jgi:hypothetical protein
MLLLAPVGAWRWRHNPHCRLLVAAALVTFLGYLLVPLDHGHAWGFRFFHSTWMVLPLLAAGALAPCEVFSGDANVRTFLVSCALLCGCQWIGMVRRAGSNDSRRRAGGPVTTG